MNATPRLTVRPDGTIARLPGPPREWGLCESDLLVGYCASGCSTPPVVAVTGESVCCECAREMGVTS